MTVNGNICNQNFTLFAYKTEFLIDASREDET